MSSFKKKQAQYSARMHAAINSVPASRWRTIRDTGIELVAGIAAVASLVGEMIAHAKFVRTAAARG